MNYEEFKEQLIFENAKSDFENWINKKFPKGWFGYNPVYIISHPWKAVEYCAREIKWAWQRAFRGWDDTVIWDIDWYLSEMIPIWVDKLKEDTHGHPMEMYEGMTPINNNWEYSEEDTNIAIKKWKDILNTISEGFRSYHYIRENALWEKDEGYMELNAKYELGFDLFKKYFGNLWD